MDAGPSSPSSAAALKTRARPQQGSPKQPQARDPALRTERILRDARRRRSPPGFGNEGERSKTGGRGVPPVGLAKTKLWASTGAQTKPLLPVTERKPHEENLAGRRAKKRSQDDDKWDITPDGGSAGREGRKFTVANVGNNGRIYLR